jgi:phosphopantetheinyl transferase (holo-ACP synthase)
VGNDIVDLVEPEAIGKFQDKRFINRVFCSSEQHVICTAALPDSALWTLWAAKESAFKIYAKRTSNPSFAHRKFICLPRASMHAAQTATPEHQHSTGCCTELRESIRAWRNP